MKKKKFLFPIALTVFVFGGSLTALAAAAEQDNGIQRMPADVFSFTMDSPGDNTLQTGPLAAKGQATDWYAGVSPTSYGGQYNLATVFASRVFDDGQGWYIHHVATNARTFASETFTLQYKSADDANAEGFFKLQCYPNYQEFYVSGWWQP